MWTILNAAFELRLNALDVMIMNGATAALLLIVVGALLIVRA